VNARWLNQMVTARDRSVEKTCNLNVSPKSFVCYRTVRGLFIYYLLLSDLSVLTFPHSGPLVKQVTFKCNTENLKEPTTRCKE
jgi:hypothetical protein